MWPILWVPRSKPSRRRARRSSIAVAAPARIYTAFEVSRMAMEAAWLTAVQPFGLGAMGDGSAVLCVPGFGADDGSLSPLRSALEKHGYEPLGWKLGPNIATPSQFRRLCSQVVHEAEVREKPISLIGHSLGGLYARELARLHPTSVRCVVTLGSPLRYRAGDRTAVGVIPRHGLKLPGSGTPEGRRPRLKMPSLSIYSMSDGLVRPELCKAIEGPLSSNVEVVSSHLGLPFNSVALKHMLTFLDSSSRAPAATNRRRPRS